jgi:5'(3')-deoxyribonucleotidase
MKRIAVDMDGVLSDVYSQLIKKHYDHCGELLSVDTMAGKRESEVFPHGRRQVRGAGFFADIPVMPGSVDTMKELNERYRIYIVSAAMEFPLSLSEKQLWLDTHFPFIGWQQRVFCGSKEVIKADIMIDDYFKNLDCFEGETYLFTQPHNCLADCGKHRRVSNWQEIGHLLL